MQSLYWIYERFQGKIIYAANDWIFIIVIKFTIIGADIADGRHDRLTANNRQRLFGVCSWPAAGDIYAHATPKWVKLLPIYERDIGQAAASPISRSSSPLSAMNVYKLEMYRMSKFRDPRKRMHMQISKDEDQRMRMQMRISVNEDPRMRMRMRIFGIL